MGSNYLVDVNVFSGWLERIQMPRVFAASVKNSLVFQEDEFQVPVLCKKCFTT